MTKRTTGPRGPANEPATSGDVAGQLPPRKKSLRYQWRTNIESLPAEEQTAAMVRRIEWVKAHPDTKAKQRIEELLQAAQLDEAVLQSPELGRFVWLMRELLREHKPDEGLEHILLPVQTLLARRGGGRLPTVDPERVRRHHADLCSRGDGDRATTLTAEFFNMSTRRVREILEG